LLLLFLWWGSPTPHYMSIPQSRVYLFTIGTKLSAN
jgi:hypothetical protein